MSSEAGLSESQIHDLSDLELAALLSLIAKEHCLLETPESSLNNTAQELALIASEVFGLSNAVLDCSENTTIDEFGDAILDQSSSRESDPLAIHEEKDRTTAWSRSNLGSVPTKAAPKASSTHRPSTANLDNRKVVNVVIAKNFNFVNDVIQIQALELIRRGRIFSRTTVHVTSEPFLFLPVVTSETARRRLNKHLLDHMFISHFHSTEDGFRNLEGKTTSHSSSPSQSSLASVVHKPSHSSSHAENRAVHKIPYESIKILHILSTRVHTSAELRAYIQNIIVFLRLERGVIPTSVSPKATAHFQLLTRCLAPLHSQTFITPSLAQLAAPKIYRHRLRLLVPEDAHRERSVMYGSEVEAVREYLEGLMGKEEEVVRGVVGRVECPL